MSLILQALRQVATASPEHNALYSVHNAMTYRQLDQAVAKMADALRALDIRALGLMADNEIPWVLADLSALVANIPLVPLPLFFSPQQILHVVCDAGLDGLLTDQPQQVAMLLQCMDIEYCLAGELGGLHLIRLQGVAAKQLPPGTAKITYTSGTTGEPKGVCLSLAQMETVAVSLMVNTMADHRDRHLCLTPLSTLLENIGGVYAPLLAGACCCVPSLSRVGLDGAAGLDAARMVQAMIEFDASSVIMAPQMLQALVMRVEAGTKIPSGLRFVAVGGAPVSPYLLKRADQLAIPVYEGYGLSECASVVALNTPDANRPGSVGRPLPHVAICFAEDGEILVCGSSFLGYLGQGEAQQPWPTGDLGYLDDEGFLHLSGRKKSLFITSFGRNVAPEWVERELTLHPAIAQAAVFGEARPFNVAVIVPRSGFDKSDIDAAVQLANRLLPDYARISDWVAASAPFTPSNHQLTANGRLKREAIMAAHGSALESLYQEELHDVF